MKILSCVAAFYLFLPLCAAASGPLFCCREGSVLRYERHYADSGKLKWTHELSVLDVVGNGEGMSVLYQSEFRNKSGRVMYGGPVALEMDVLADGTLMVDLAGSVASAFSSLLSDSMVSWEPCLSRLPAVLSAGDVLQDASFSVSVAGVPYRVTVSDRKVKGTERIKTAAGSFDCVVVSEHKEERGLGRRRITDSITWYAPGIGMVRHDTYTKGRLETSEQLVSMTIR